MTKMCVLGATGQTGSAIVNEALGKGMHVLALVRNPEKVTLKHDNLTVVKAEISDYGSANVLPQIAECDHVVVALGSKKLWGDPIRSEGTKSILNALKKSGHQPRIWCISSAGTRDSLAQMGVVSKLLVFTLLNRVIADHAIQEEILINSGFPYTILRPTGLTNEPATGNYKLVSDGMLETSQISRADIAHCLVSKLDQTDLLNKAVCLTKV
ncbi:MAG: NAD(P)-dependent oxidoreductase [Anaerolineae bacterium]